MRVFLSALALLATSSIPAAAGVYFFNHPALGEIRFYDATDPNEPVICPGGCVRGRLPNCTWT